MYIELKNVSKKIKGIDILDDVSLRMDLERYMVSGERMEVVRQCLCVQ